MGTCAGITDWCNICICVIGVMAIWVAVMLYSFAMLSRYDNNVIVTLKNSLIVSVHHLPQTIIMLIATVGLVYFSCIYFTAFIVTIPLILYVDSFIFSSIFKHLEKNQSCLLYTSPSPRD